MSETYGTSPQEIVVARAIRTAINEARKYINMAWATNPDIEMKERKQLLFQAANVFVSLPVTVSEAIASLHEPKRGVITCILKSAAAGAEEAIKLKSIFCLERLLDPEGFEADRLEYAISILESEHFGIIYPGICPRCGSGQDQHGLRPEDDADEKRNVFCKRCGAFVYVSAP